MAEGILKTETVFFKNGGMRVKKGPWTGRFGKYEENCRSKCMMTCRNARPGRRFPGKNTREALERIEA